MWDRNATPIWKLADLNIEHVVGMGLSAQAGVKQVGQVGGRALQDGLHLLPPVPVHAVTLFARIFEHD
jgi:hypothetical protein